MGKMSNYSRGYLPPSQGIVTPSVQAGPVFVYFSFLHPTGDCFICEFGSHSPRAWTDSPYSGDRDENQLSFWMWLCLLRGQGQAGGTELAVVRDSSFWHLAGLPWVSRQYFLPSIASSLSLSKHKSNKWVKDTTTRATKSASPHCYCCCFGGDS